MPAAGSGLSDINLNRDAPLPLPQPQENDPRNSARQISRPAPARVRLPVAENCRAMDPRPVPSPVVPGDGGQDPGRLGMTPQRPWCRAYQPNAAAVRTGIEETYPALVQEQGALLLLADEDGRGGCPRELTQGGWAAGGLGIRGPYGAEGGLARMASGRPHWPCGWHRDPRLAAPSEVQDCSSCPKRKQSPFAASSACTGGRRGLHGIVALARASEAEPSRPGPSRSIRAPPETRLRRPA